MRANYKIETNDSAGNVKETSLILWRKGKEVAHQYPQTGITEAWQLIKGNRLKPIRFFDHFERAIEYQPGETVHGKRETDWSNRYQLISDSVLSKMTNYGQESTIASECKLAQKVAHIGDTTLTLNWLTNQKLIKQFHIKKGNQSVVWTLESVESDVDKINAFFETRHNYYVTDFADIGDDHTDPFLTQMVTQGFIEHGASGFYNDKGETIGHHNH
ncbi:hypothetical protein KIU71_09250 [Alteromonas sp. SM 2104]|nr:hypothetical protein [Alteromonas oceanisediminis]